MVFFCLYFNYVNVFQCKERSVLVKKIVFYSVLYLLSSKCLSFHPVDQMLDYKFFFVCFFLCVCGTFKNFYICTLIGMMLMLLYRKNGKFIVIAYNTVKMRNHSYNKCAFPFMCLFHFLTTVIVWLLYSLNNYTQMLNTYQLVTISRKGCFWMGSYALW